MEPLKTIIFKKFSLKKSFLQTKLDISQLNFSKFEGVFILMLSTLVNIFTLLPVIEYNNNTKK